MSLILASASPRRRALMELLRRPFTVQVAQVDEYMDQAVPVAQAVAQVSCRKAMAVNAAPEDVVVGADTVVVLDDRVLGKPADPAHAKQMLKALSGKTHQVMTGLCVKKGECIITHTEITQVRFRTLSDREIDDYVATGEPMDKAGAYGIQGFAAAFVEDICGDYYNVVGLPVCKLGQVLTLMMEERK